MKTFFRNVSEDRDRLNIIILLTIGVLIRFWGIGYGLPAVYNSTEYFIAKHALSLGARKTLEPLFFIYPTFYTYFVAGLFGGYFVAGYLTGFFSSSTDFALQFLIDPTSFYLLGRTANAVLILLAIVLLYKTLRLLVNPQISLLVSMLLLVSCSVHEYTFWMVPDALLTAGSVTVLYFMVRLFQRGLNSRQMIVASLICGLTITTKYNAGFLALGWLTALAFDSRYNWVERVKRTGLSGTLVIAGFLLGSPYWILAFNRFWDGFQMITSQAVYAYNFEKGIPYLWELTHLVRMEGVLGVLLLILLLKIPINRNRLTFSLTLIIWPTFLYVGSWEKKGLDYLLVMYPALLVFLGVLLRQYRENQKMQKIITLVAIAALIVNIPRVLHSDYLRTQPDTRELVSDWIRNNLPAGSSICYDHYHYDLHLIDLDRYLQYGEGSRHLGSGIKQKLAEFRHLSYNYRFISAQEQLQVPNLPDSLLSIVKGDSFLWQNYTHPHKTLDEIVKDGAELLILNSETYSKFLENPLPDPDNPLRMDFRQRRNFYRQVLETMKPVRIFRPDWYRPGPTLQIFNLKGN